VQTLRIFSSNNGKNLYQYICLTLIVLLPLSSFNRNPDLTHDSYFFSQAVALLDGAQIHSEIYSPYGPFVPWLLAIFITVFGEYLIIGRILGLVVLYITCILFHKILKNYISSRVAITFTTLFVALSPERTELSSPRWVYGSGIWPTTLVILLTLLILVIIKMILENPKFDSRVELKIFLCSIFLGILIFSRIQGILIFLIYTLITIIILSYQSAYVKRLVIISYMGFIFGLTPMITYLYMNKVLITTVNQMILSPFSAAGVVMQNRWLGWALSLFLIFITSVLAMATLIWVMDMLIKKAKISSLVLLIVVGTPAIYLAGKFDYPDDLNKNPLLYFLKILTQFPYWWAFSVFATFLILTINSLSKLLRDKVNKNNWISPSAIENLSCILLGVGSLTHLFWNYGYIYNVFPVLVIAVLSSYVKVFKSSRYFLNTFKLMQASVVILTIISLLGFTQKSMSYESDTLKGFISTQGEVSNLNLLLKNLDDLRLENTSQFLCGWLHFFRITDSESFKRDLPFFEHPPDSNLTYLSAVDLGVKNVIVCGEENFFKEIDLTGLNWRVEAEWTLSGLPSIQVLGRGSRG
jgi:hypothetical protein